MTRRAAIIACTMFAVGCGPGATRPLLSGPRDAVRQAATAARDCGIAKLRIDPLDDRSAMLVVDPATSPAAVACVRRWAGAHRNVRLQGASA